MVVADIEKHNVEVNETEENKYFECGGWGEAQFQEDSWILARYYNQGMITYFEM